MLEQSSASAEIVRLNEIRRKLESECRSLGIELEHEFPLLGPADSLDSDGSPIIILMLYAALVILALLGFGRGEVLKALQALF